MIIIEEPKKEGYKPTLKLKNLLAAEYAVISKTFTDPITGTSIYGEWNNYGIEVHEILSVDPKTLDKSQNADLGEASFFPSPKLHEQIKSIPIGVKMKITAEEIEGKHGTFTKYNAEILDKIEANVTAQSATPGISADDKIKTLKTSGVPRDMVITLVTKEYDLPEAVVGKKYDSH